MPSGARSGNIRGEPCSRYSTEESQVAYDARAGVPAGELIFSALARFQFLAKPLDLFAVNAGQETDMAVSRFSDGYLPQLPFGLGDIDDL